MWLEPDSIFRSIFFNAKHLYLLWIALLPLRLTFLKLIFTGVWLIYNVVLVSAVQQSESVIHIHTSTLF